MRHPFSGKALILYFSAWVAVMAAYSFLLYFVFGFSLYISILDSVVHNVPIAGLGMAFWYVVQYLSPRSDSYTGPIFNLIAAVLVGVSMASYGSYSVAKLVDNGVDYQTFLTNTLPWRIFIGALVMAVIVMIYYLLKSNRELHEKEAEERELQGLLKQSELDMLKFQINPHFIFNSLNSISSLTITEPAKAREMVIKLSDFFRSSLGKGNEELQPIKDEIKRMELYLDIEKVRFGERLKLENSFDGKCESMKVPNMILQPLYENAIKYGVYEQLEGVTINTNCHCADGNLHISISNGYDSEAIPQKGKGIGLKNIRNRLELIYGISDLVTIEKEQHLFTVKLLIPQKEDR
ncbi:MAG: histidine kinase [Bacteroidota bacterium]